MLIGKEHITRPNRRVTVRIKIEIVGPPKPVVSALALTLLAVGIVLVLLGLRFVGH